MQQGNAMRTLASIGRGATREIGDLIEMTAIGAKVAQRAGRSIALCTTECKFICGCCLEGWLDIASLLLRWPCHKWILCTYRHAFASTTNAHSRCRCCGELVRSRGCAHVRPRSPGRFSSTAPAQFCNSHCECTPRAPPLVIRAGGVEHKVSPLGSGRRRILKMAFVRRGCELREDMARHASHHGGGKNKRKKMGNKGKKKR